MQTREGAAKATQTIRKKYGDDFYKNLGKIGGMKSRGGGFAEGSIGSRRAKQAGSIGGSRSRIGLKFVKEGMFYYHYLDKQGRKVKVKK